MTDLRSDAIDRTKIVKGLRLQRDFYVRVIRSLQAMNGFDPQIGDPSQIPDLRLSDSVHYEALVLDASQPPFRNNGKGFQFTASLGAGGAGNFNEWLVQNQPDLSKVGVVGTAVVIDEIDYKGASDVTYGICTATDPPLSTFGKAIIVEDPFGRPDKANTLSGVVARFADVQTESGVFGAAPTDGVTWDVIGFIGGTPAAGPSAIERPEPIVLWPRMALLVVQDTANVAGRVLIKGRYFSFGTVATGQLQT